MISEQSLNAYYAMRAPYYDEVYEKPERQADIKFLREALTKRFMNCRVLEVACGTGFWSQFIASSASQLVATDALHEPLVLARRKTNSASIQFEQADAYHLPSTLGMFESAFAGLFFSHVPICSRRLFLAGLHKLMLPDARVILIDNSEIQCLEWPIIYRDEFGNTYQHRRTRDGAVHRVLKNFPTEAELRVVTNGIGENAQYRALDNFWMYEYTVTRAVS